MTHQIVNLILNDVVVDLGCVPIKLYLWTVKLELYIIFTCHEILLWIFFQSFQNVKPF